MIVGAVLVLCYERLLTRWARKGFSDLQKLGLITGALGFFALFLDWILELLEGWEQQLWGWFSSSISFGSERISSCIFPRSERRFNSGLRCRSQPNLACDS
jgi:hypothetical protein